jgi:hypothetical protein
MNTAWYRRLSACIVLGLAGSAVAATDMGHCPGYRAGKKNLYWGDLHVHTAYSLDAYGFGTVKTPADAYRFARGQEIELPDRSKARLARPLDFVSVTDHAEWFDLMYLCTHPLFADDPYCVTLRRDSGPQTGGKVFAGYVAPTITLEKPAITPLCAADPQRCLEASVSQWQRIQEQAHAAYDACRFTSFVGFEWSATPAKSHTHRNVIFANEHVTDRAIDYIRYPSLDQLWGELDQRCRPQDGCDVITIPHNTNMSDGRGFDIETESPRTLELRHRFERLAEIHQEKGNSECLSPLGALDENDCGFELYLTRSSRPGVPADFTAAEWEATRRGYLRSVLIRGLAAYQQSGGVRRNPLQLGLIGSTDTHAATPGHVEEDQWHGSVFGAGDFARVMTRVDWNPGGLVAVWAEENTRESLFAALKRREVYATSGPRIGLQFSAATGKQKQSCASWGATDEGTVAMGGDLTDGRASPQFRIVAQFDQVPLQRVEIIKGEWRDGAPRERVITLWSGPGEGKGAGQGEGRSICQTWTDPDFAADAPAFWYVRVLQQPTLRWSAVRCRQYGQCGEFPRADQTIQERAWSSPIWYLPAATASGAR